MYPSVIQYTLCDFFYRFHAVVVDGHDVEELCRNFHEATTAKGKPTCFIAKTFKGTIACVCGALIV